MFLNFSAVNYLFYAKAIKLAHAYLDLDASNDILILLYIVRQPFLHQDANRKHSGEVVSDEKDNRLKAKSCGRVTLFYLQER